jgi:hypothetical protein
MAVVALFSMTVESTFFDPGQKAVYIAAGSGKHGKSARYPCPHQQF